jgi:Domain of unknown function (DUF4383)
MRRATFDTRWPFSPVQWAAVVGALTILAWSIPGMIVNPDFGVGNSAHSVQVLGSDMNGWHALSGFLVAIPALLVAPWPRPAAAYVCFAAAGLIATAIWALFETRIAGGLFSFPHNGTDALLHFATSAIFLAGAAHYYLTRSSPWETSRPGPRSSARSTGASARPTS